MLALDVTASRLLTLDAAVRDLPRLASVSPECAEIVREARRPDCWITDAFSTTGIVWTCSPTSLTPLYYAQVCPTSLRESADYRRVVADSLRADADVRNALYRAALRHERVADAPLACLGHQHRHVARRPVELLYLELIDALTRTLRNGDDAKLPLEEATLEAHLAQYAYVDAPHERDSTELADLAEAFSRGRHRPTVATLAVKPFLARDALLHARERGSLGARLVAYTADPDDLRFVQSHAHGFDFSQVGRRYSHGAVEVDLDVPTGPCILALLFSCDPPAANRSAPQPPHGPCHAHPTRPRCLVVRDEALLLPLGLLSLTPS